MGQGGRPKAELALSTEERLVLERLANRRKSAQADDAPTESPPTARAHLHGPEGLFALGEEVAR